MVLTKAELIAALQDEVRILLHLTGKVDPAMSDYRPTPVQRSTSELIKYLSFMGPTIVKGAIDGTFDETAWEAAKKRAAAGSLQDAVEAIRAHGTTYASLLGDLTDDDLRAEIEVFGEKTSRGAFLVRWVLSGCAAYRMQLFLYLKACGQSELGTMNLWAGVDAPPTT